MNAFGPSLTRDAAKPRPPLPLWLLYPLIFAAVYLSHITLLRLPYFWDEAGYYIPAAWDFFRTGTLIPHSTVTNAHPPLPSILLAGWWHLSGFVPSGTRTFICMISAAALLAVFRLSRSLLGIHAAAAVTLLTGVYPVWFAQSTLAHADIFAALFTLWALAVYLPARSAPGASSTAITGTAALFWLSVLSKETAIVTPAALAFIEAVQFVRDRDSLNGQSRHAAWFAALASSALPLQAWYAYHFHRTGFVFGNPEFLRYNATANLDPNRIALCLYHRLLHLTAHMNMFVPVACGIAAALLPKLSGARRFPPGTVQRILVILLANWIAFSVLGGALLTRYLLPMYPLVLMLCVAEWQRHLRFSEWSWLAALSAAAFAAGILVNPPYAFAPEDNLTYRDFVVLQQRAIGYIAQHDPGAAVLTAWPAYAELERPELGYTTRPIRAVAIENFSAQQVHLAAERDNLRSGPTTYSMALVFSTKWAPAPGTVDLSRPGRQADAKYFDFHQDLRPAQIASMLGGQVVWQAAIRGEWAAVLQFPRAAEAVLQ